MLDSRQLNASGMFLMILGGWFDWLRTKSGVLRGLVYGLNFPVLRSSVTSRKLTTFLFASMVVFRLFLANIWHISFFALCKARFQCQEVVLVATGGNNPPVHRSPLSRSFPMVTSKFNVKFLFSHGWPSLNSREFLELMIVCRSLAEMIRCSEAKSSARFKRASEIEG